MSLAESPRTDLADCLNRIAAVLETIARPPADDADPERWRRARLESVDTSEPVFTAAMDALKGGADHLSDAEAERVVGLLWRDVKPTLTEARHHLANDEPIPEAVADRAGELARDLRGWFQTLGDRRFVAGGEDGPRRAEALASVADRLRREAADLRACPDRHWWPSGASDYLKTARVKLGKLVAEAAEYVTPPDQSPTRCGCTVTNGRSAASPPRSSWPTGCLSAPGTR